MRRSQRRSMMIWCRPSMVHKHLYTLSTYKIPRDPLYQPFFPSLYKTYSEWQTDFNQFVHLIIGAIAQPLRRKELFIHTETVKAFFMSGANNGTPSAVELGICIEAPLLFAIGEILRIPAIDFYATSKSKKSLISAPLLNRCSTILVYEDPARHVKFRR